MVYQKGIEFALSDKPLVTLPDGWKWDISGIVAVAVAPDGKRYLYAIKDAMLYPWLICPPEGLAGSALKSGQTYFDKRGSILLTHRLKSSTLQENQSNGY